MKLSRSVSAAMRSIGCPVFSARIRFRRSRVYRISLAWISMSEAWPCAPPDGWWIMIRALGSAKRLPFSPAASRNAPMLAAMPMHSVLTGGLTNCIVS